MEKQNNPETPKTPTRRIVYAVLLFAAGLALGYLLHKCAPLDQWSGLNF